MLRRFAGERPCFSFKGIKKPTIPPPGLREPPISTPQSTTLRHQNIDARAAYTTQIQYREYRIATAATPREAIDKSLV